MLDLRSNIYFWPVVCVRLSEFPLLQIKETIQCGILQRRVLAPPTGLHNLYLCFNQAFSLGNRHKSIRRGYNTVLIKSNIYIYIYKQPHVYYTKVLDDWKHFLIHWELVVSRTVFRPVCNSGCTGAQHQFRHAIVDHSCANTTASPL